MILRFKKKVKSCIKRCCEVHEEYISQERVGKEFQIFLPENKLLLILFFHKLKFLLIAFIYINF